MENIYQRMCNAQLLENHPVLNETIKYKKNYILVLQYFCNKYCCDNKFSIAMLDLYKQKFLGAQITDADYSSKEIKKTIQYATAIKFRKFKLFSHRFTLILDCLFLCAFHSESIAKDILSEIKTLFSSRYHKKIDSFFETLYFDGTMPDKINVDSNMLKCWNENKAYAKLPQKSILITANMSSGKSTLINSLIGKKICQTRNDACTAKIHHIQSKAFEDFYTYEYDNTLSLNATQAMLMDNNEDNSPEQVLISTYFRFFKALNDRFLFIDTPGVNSSMDQNHLITTRNALLESEYDKVLYVINAENIGTDDDRYYLQYLLEVVKNKKIIFVVNKLDRFKQGEDNIEESLDALKKDLLKLGFSEPQICPISAYAGFLSKKKLWNESLNEDEIGELDVLVRKFKRQEFDLSQYYSLEEQEYGTMLVNSQQDEKTRKYISLLNNSGILALENIIMK